MISVWTTTVPVFLGILVLVFLASSPTLHREDQRVESSTPDDSVEIPAFQVSELEIVREYPHDASRRKNPELQILTR